MDGEFSIEKPRIARLTGPNYRPWSVQVKRLLQAQGLWQIVDEGPTKGLNTGSTGPEQGVKDAKASTILMGMCGQGPLQHILLLETAQEQWKKLKALYAPLGMQQLNTKVQAFVGYKPRADSASIAEISTELDTLQAEIAAISPEERPSDTLKVSVLYQAVRTKDTQYEPVILQLGLADITEYDKIVAQLTEFERRIGAKPLKESAFSAETGKRVGRKGLKAFHGNCYHCGKLGHRIAECRALKRGEQKASTGPLPTPGGGRGLSPGPVHAQGANVATETSWVATVGTQEPRAQGASPLESDHIATETTWMAGAGTQTATIQGAVPLAWVIDSGCTRHMTYARDAFTQYSRLDTPTPVNTASGACIEAIAEGTVAIQVAVKGTIRTVTLSRVLHVPGLAGSLISVPQLQDRGILTRTTLGGKLLLELQGKVVGIAVRIGRTYTLKSTLDGDVAAYRVTVANQESSKTWHRRFGHLSTQSLQHVHTVTTGLLGPIHALAEPCEACILNKTVRVINRQTPERANRALGRVYTDAWGPYRVPALNGDTYFFSFTDDYTRKSWVYTTKSRASLRTIFTEFRTLTELETGLKLQVVRCDNISEYKALSALFGPDYGIQFEFTTTYTPEQNGVAERLNRSLVTVARAMLTDAKLPAQFWADAVLTACYLRNRTPIGPGGVTPEEAYSGKRPRIDHLRAWGCIAYAHLAPENRDHLDKLHPTARRTCLIGYMPTSRQYKLYDPKKREVVVSTAPRFLENRHLDLTLSELEPGVDTPEFDPMEADFGAEASIEIGDNSMPNTPTGPDDRDHNTSNSTANSEGSSEDSDQGAEQQLLQEAASTEPALDLENEHAHNNLDLGTGPRRSGRARKPTRRSEQAYLASANTIAIPKSYTEALNDPVNGVEWGQATATELTKLQALGTWEYAELPKGKRTVGSKWVFTVKYTPTGLLDRFKARLVAQGFSQVPGDDYLETYSPTIRADSLRILLAIAAHEDLEARQVDVVSAYPHSDLHAEVYMRPPEGLDAPKGKVLRVLKSLYGLKQSGREWYIEACKGLKSLGFRPTYSDPSVLVTADLSLILGLYVDDMLILGRDQQAIERTVQGIKALWEVKDLGDVGLILGLRVHRDRGLRTLSIDQSSYIQQCIQRFGIGEAKPVPVPVSDRNTLIAGTSDEPQADQALYQQAIGCLSWIAGSSRFDISYAVGQLSQHCNAPTVRHWNGVLRVFRYLNGTSAYRVRFGNQGLYGPKLQGFCDSDYAGDCADRRSVSGQLYLLAGGLVSWSSTKQRCVATSTTEAEYIALSEASKQGQWIRGLIKELQCTDLLEQSLATPIYSDNQGCLAIAQDPIGHRRTKHIDVRYHYIRELIAHGKATVSYLPTADMVADILTKPLAATVFNHCIQGLLTL